MSPELLIAIALLCLPGNDKLPSDVVYGGQKSCQQRLILCVALRKLGQTPAAALGECVVNSK